MNYFEKNRKFTGILKINFHFYVEPGICATDYL